MSFHCAPPSRVWCHFHKKHLHPCQLIDHLKSGLDVIFTGQWRSTQLKVRQNEKTDPSVRLHLKAMWMTLPPTRPTPTPLQSTAHICKTGVSYGAKALKADSLLHQQLKDKCSHHDWHIRDFFVTFWLHTVFPFSFWHCASFPPTHPQSAEFLQYDAFPLLLSTLPFI